MYKKIAIIGRARVGKSRICSRFCRYTDLITKHFTGAGSDCTPVNIRFVIKRECSDKENIIRFISPESSLNGIQAHLDGKSIEKFLYDINNNTYSKDVLEKAGQKKELNSKTDTIEITTLASDLALSIMDNDDDGLIITDTPGVSGDVEGLQNISDADVYILVMRPENSTEYTASINKMLPIIAGSRVLFIYNMGTAVDDADDYQDMENEAKNAMNDFVKELAKLSNSSSIINTSLEVLNPVNTVIPMGSFNLRKVNYAENKFNDALCNALNTSFNITSYTKEESEIVEALSNAENNKQEIIDYIRTIINQFQPNNITSSQNYAQQFLSERHDRVKFNDGYSTFNIVNENRTELLNELYDYFDELTVDNLKINIVEKILQESIIKYCYKKLTLAIKFDCGVSKGNHPFEANPPITMWAEESVIAEKLLATNATSNRQIYCNVMKKMGFKSKSWDYVSVPFNPYSGNLEHCNHKLEIIQKCQLNLMPSNNTKTLIYNSYNLSLLKLGQYSIYDFIIKKIGSSDNAIDWL